MSALAGASGHALYDSDGTVYACGLNRNGVLGDGSTRNSTTPVRVARLNGSSVTQLVAGFDNAGALLSNGKYFDWGYDADGQLGNGPARRPSRARQTAGTAGGGRVASSASSACHCPVWAPGSPR